MARNVEIKARLPDAQADRIRRRALARSPVAPEVLHQTDTFYATPSGRLKLRRLHDGRAELVAYDRPDATGPALSAYDRVACDDPDALHAVLARTLGVRGVVEKRREVVLLGQTRVHLDDVKGLGRFLELEVVLREDQSPEEGRAIAVALMELLGIAPESLVECAYIDLLERALDRGLA